MNNDVLMQFLVHDIVDNGEVLTPATDTQKRQFIHEAIDALDGPALEAVSLATLHATCAETARGWREEAE